MTGSEDHRPSADRQQPPTGGPPALESRDLGRWRIVVVEESGSTNADVAERFRAGEREGLVLVAEHQTAGRGRLGRAWVSPPRASLTVSFLLEPEVPAERWTWLPLLTGVAAARAVRRSADVAADLKWPNDVLVGGAKLGGILLERVEQEGRAAAVVGIGLNVHQAQDDLPVPGATSLDLVAGPGAVDRASLLTALVEELSAAYDEWRGGEDPRAAYLRLCVTPGHQVTVSVPGGEVVGEATDVDAQGRLVVLTDQGEQALGAGDVVHVRPR